MRTFTWGITFGAWVHSRMLMSLIVNPPVLTDNHPEGQVEESDVEADNDVDMLTKEVDNSIDLRRRRSAEFPVHPAFPRFQRVEDAPAIPTKGPFYNQRMLDYLLRVNRTQPRRPFEGVIPKLGSRFSNYQFHPSQAYLDLKAKLRNGTADNSTVLKSPVLGFRGLPRRHFTGPKATVIDLYRQFQNSTTDDEREAVLEKVANLPVSPYRRLPNRVCRAHLAFFYLCNRHRMVMGLRTKRNAIGLSSLLDTTTSCSSRTCRPRIIPSRPRCPYLPQTPSRCHPQGVRSKRASSPLIAGMSQWAYKRFGPLLSSSTTTTTTTPSPIVSFDPKRAYRLSVDHGVLSVVPYFD